MSLLAYVSQRILVTAIRYIASRNIQTTPDEVVNIPSRDNSRTIKAHLYRSKATGKPSPILINFHGSGFVIPLHGSDDEFAHYIVRETDYAVLDVAYRLAPEHPHPAAVEDAEDAIKWVLARPQDFDSSSFTLSGFSAGANLALVACSTLFPKETFNLVIAVYPPTDLKTEPKSKAAPDPTGKPIADWLANTFNACYVPPPIDRAGPTVSPTYTPGEQFPDHLVMITCAGDNLCLEGETLAKKIESVPGKRVVWRRMEGCDHGWDKSCKPGTSQEKARDEAYRLIADEMRS